MVGGLGKYVLLAGLQGQAVLRRLLPGLRQQGGLESIQLLLILGPQGEQQLSPPGGDAEGPFPHIDLHHGAHHQAPVALRPGERRNGGYHRRHGIGRVAAQLRGAGVGGRAGEAENQPLGGAVHGAGPQGHRPQGVAGHVVEGVHLSDARLLQEGGAGLSPAADLLGALEDQVGVPGRSLPVQHQAQQGQGGAVAVVAALVGRAGALGAVRQRRGLLHGQGVKVGPEGHFPRSPAPAQGVEPASPVHHLQACVSPEEVHQGLFGPCLPAGQLRVGVEGVAQGHGPVQQGVIHGFSPFPSPPAPPWGAPPPGSPAPGGGPPW